MSNYSVLEDNVLSSFDCEVAKVAFLWARERIENDRYAYKAEEFARQVQNINAWSSWVLPMAAKPLAHLKSEDEMIDTLHDLKNYILDRLVGMYIPNEKRSFTNRFDLFESLT